MTCAAKNKAPELRKISDATRLKLTGQVREKGKKRPPRNGNYKRGSISGGPLHPKETETPGTPASLTAAVKRQIRDLDIQSAGASLVAKRTWARESRIGPPFCFHVEPSQSDAAVRERRGANWVSR